MRSNSPYDVVFSKRLIFGKGGGPALYLRGNTLRVTSSVVSNVLTLFVSGYNSPNFEITPGTSNLFCLLHFLQQFVKAFIGIIDSFFHVTLEHSVTISD